MKKRKVILVILSLLFIAGSLVSCTQLKKTETGDVSHVVYGYDFFRINSEG